MATKVPKHSRKNCPYLHIKNCPGCGRSCWCYKTSKQIAAERNKQWREKHAA